jgi:hypothetical protein
MEKLLGAAGSGAASSDVVFDIPLPGLFDNKCFSLTKKQRLYGFVGCFIVGIALSIFSSFFITTMNLAAFGVCYTFGNIVAIFSTAFILGKTMCARPIHFVAPRTVVPSQPSPPLALPLFTSCPLARAGPWQQMKNMFHRKRVLATLLYLVTLIGTLLVAFLAQSAIGE